MKMKIGRQSGLRVNDLSPGSIFQFVNSITDQVYQMSTEGAYQSLKTGDVFDVSSCCPDARVIRYSKVEIDLGEPDGNVQGGERDE